MNQDLLNQLIIEKIIENIIILTKNYPTLQFLSLEGNKQHIIHSVSFQIKSNEFLLLSWILLNDENFVQIEFENQIYCFSDLNLSYHKNSQFEQDNWNKCSFRKIISILSGIEDILYVGLIPASLKEEILSKIKKNFVSFINYSNTLIKE